MSPAPATTEQEDTLLIQAAAAWRTARDRPSEGRDLADRVVQACGRGDEEALVAALRARGWAERVLYQHDAAGKSLNEAVRIARRHRLRDRLVEALISRTSLELELGHSGAALRDMAEAHAVLDGGSTVALDAQEALVQMKLGHHARAVEAGRTARARLVDETDSVMQVMVLVNLGEALSHLGRFREADEAFEEGLAVASTIGRLSVGMTIQTQAAAAVRCGRIAEALVAFDRAEEILEEAGWPLGEHHLERIVSFADLRLVDEAEASVVRAVRHFEQSGFVLLLAETRLRQARLLLDDDRPAEAADAANHAAELFRRQRRHGYRAHADVTFVEARFASGCSDLRDLRRAERALATLENAGALGPSLDAHLAIGRLAERHGRAGLAVEHFDAVARSPRVSGPLARIKAALADALAARVLGDSVRLRRAATTGLRQLSVHRALLPSTELRSLASGHGVELASLGLESALQSGQARRVLDWMERGRFASLLTDPPRPQDETLDAWRARLREVVTEQQAAIDDPAQQARLATEQVRLENRIQRRLRTLEPGASQATAAAGAAAIESALGVARSLLEFAVVQGRLVCVMRSRGWTILDVGDAELIRHQADALLSSLRRITRARTDASKEAALAGVRASLAELDRQLIAPLADRLGTEVLLVPTGTLFAVPWHALPSLAGRHVAIAPSATVWARAEPAGVIDRPVIVAGPRLKGAAEEALAVGAFYRAAQVIAPPESTVRNVAGALDGAALAHLACHGTFRADNPSFSALELADGPLTVLDFESMRRAPGTVVLAACESGASQVLPGEELRGFISALFNLGTRSIVAAAVPVPDITATSLMVPLHRELATGSSMSQALEVARREMDLDDPNGFVVATAFVHFGSD